MRLGNFQTHLDIDQQILSTSYEIDMLEFPSLFSFSFLKSILILLVILSMTDFRESVFVQLSNKGSEIAMFEMDWQNILCEIIEILEEKRKKKQKGIG